MVVLAPNRPPNPEEYECICQLVYRHSRIKLDYRARAQVLARLRDRLQATGLGDYKEYCEHLESSAGGDELCDLLAGLARETPALFASRPHLEFLAEKILPAWVTNPMRQPGDVFRAWSAGCSSGEEAYSIAIVLADFFAHWPELSARVTASDMSARMISRAREGIYRLDDARWPDPDWQRRYFVRGVGAYLGWWRAKEEVKHMITFRQGGLFDGRWPFIARMDVIFCANLNRFDSSTRQALSARLIGQLAPGGFLLAPESEFGGDQP